MRSAPWLAAAGAAALWRGFVVNDAAVFYGGLAVLVVALALGTVAAHRARIRLLPELGLAALAILCVFASIEVAWALRDALRPGPGVFGADFYTYERARADREGFERWWDVHLLRWARLDPKLVMPDPTGRNPYVLTPGALVTRGDSTIRINRLGFRGPEIQPKGERFRVVALGESTTFGITVTASDRPWPEVLGERIASDLVCDRPVEVINGGVPGWTLANQLQRLASDVMPLDPDLLISYHGSNGFLFFLGDVEGLAFVDPSATPPRPSRILRVLERDLHTRPLRARQPGLGAELPRVDDRALDASAYARLYRELVQAARDRGVRAALATFVMAVDAGSPEEVISFFEGPYPDVRSRIVANRLHSRIVQRVARAGGAIAIDASPGLDGSYREDFVDLVHFTQTGRDRLAENMLEGLRAELRDEPSLRCRPRAAAPRPR